MDALKRSLADGPQAASSPAKATASTAANAAAKTKGKKPKKRVEGQREMLLPISGKRAKEEPRVQESKVQESKKAEKPVRTGTRAKKAS
jgi:DNA end-binding protein Ku